MPFTLAHPAAILPLRGVRYLRTAPLVIGAVIPDLPYYVPGALGRMVPQTHSFEYSLTIDPLLGYAALVAVFALQAPLTALLSPRARWLCLQALAPFRTRPLEWLFAPVAIVIGVWTHLAWDSFTHPNGWIVKRVAALSAPVTIGPYSGTVCHVLQYLSSVFGLMVLAVWYQHLPAPPSPPPSRARSSSGPTLVLAAAAAILIGGVQATEHLGRTATVYHTVEVFLTHGLAWFGLLYLVAGTLAALEQARQREMESGA
jgi:Domain of unknown function (DUF4184)